MNTTHNFHKNRAYMTGAQLIEAIKTQSFQKINPESNYTGISINSQKIMKGNIFIGIKGQKFDGSDFAVEAVQKGASCVIVEKINEEDREFFINHNIDFIVVPNSIITLREMAEHRIANDLSQAKIIAITGSAGKTTVTQAISGLLESSGLTVGKTKGNQNNLIGAPLSILKASKNSNVLVLEIGTNQAGEISYLSKMIKPNIGIVLNTGSAHIGNFDGSTKKLALEKYSIVDGMDSSGILLLNGEDKHIEEGIKKAKDKNINFVFKIGKNSDCNVYTKSIRQGLFFSTDLDIVFQEGDIKKEYPLNVHTAFPEQAFLFVFVYTVAKLMRIPSSKVYEFIDSFESLSDRGRVTTISTNGKKSIVINDTYNSNPDALKLGIDAVQKLDYPHKREIFVIADMMELGDLSDDYHKNIADTIENKKDHDVQVFLVGEQAKLAAPKLEKKGIKITLFEDSKGLGEKIKDLIEDQDMIYFKGSNATKINKVVDHLFYGSYEQ